MITYRKTKKGDWVAFGPVTEMCVGSVTVTKRDGSTKTETVTGLGAPFTVEGKTCCYGYLAEKAKRTTESKGSCTCAECGKKGRNFKAVADSSGLWGECCPRCASYAPYERSFA